MIYEALERVQAEFLAERDPVSGHLALGPRREVLRARIEAGFAPLELIDCLDPLDLAELVPALEVLLQACDCGCPRKEMAGWAALEILRGYLERIGALASQRTIPPARRCCPQK